MRRNTVRVQGLYTMKLQYVISIFNKNVWSDYKKRFFQYSELQGDPKLSLGFQTKLWIITVNIFSFWVCEAIGTWISNIVTLAVMCVWGMRNIYSSRYLVINLNLYYIAASCYTVYSKLAFALLVVPVQLCRCIKIHTSKAFISSYYSNTTDFCPTGHHEAYKL
jgi:hypothetical protein